MLKPREALDSAMTNFNREKSQTTGPPSERPEVTTHRGLGSNLHGFFGGKSPRRKTIVAKHQMCARMLHSIDEIVEQGTRVIKRMQGCRQRLICHVIHRRCKIGNRRTFHGELRQQLRAI